MWENCRWKMNKYYNGTLLFKKKWTAVDFGFVHHSIEATKRMILSIKMVIHQRNNEALLRIHVSIKNNDKTAGKPVYVMDPIQPH